MPFAARGARGGKRRRLGVGVRAMSEESTQADPEQIRAQKLERKQKAEALAAAHGVDVSTAFHLVDRGITFEEFLENRKRREERTANESEKWREANRKAWTWFKTTDDMGQNYLKDRSKRRADMLFALHRAAPVVGKLVKVEPFHVHLQVGDKFKKVHKLHVQFCCDLKHAAKAQRAVRLDEEVKKLRLGIVGNTKERYVVQDRVFLDWKKRRMLLEFAFRGGEVLIGSIKYFGRFELLIDIGPPGEVLLCKHALNSIQPSAT